MPEKSQWKGWDAQGLAEGKLPRIQRIGYFGLESSCLVPFPREHLCSIVEAT